MDGISVALQGRLGQDAELRYTAQAKPMLRFSVGVQDGYGKERGEPVQWVRCVVFGEQAEQLAEQGLAKGTEVYVEGKLRLGRWQPADGGPERVELELVAFTVQPLGRVGHRRKDRADAAS